MSDASNLATSHYPETLDRIFVIGAPLYFPTIWGWAQKWVDPITVVGLAWRWSGLFATDETSHSPSSSFFHKPTWPRPSRNSSMKQTFLRSMEDRWIGSLGRRRTWIRP